MSSVDINGKTIIIKTTEQWYCTVYGNFILDKYSGQGDTTLTIIPIDNNTINGYVTFIIGNIYCPSKYTVIVKCEGIEAHLSVTPESITFKGKGESATCNVDSTSSWYIDNESIYNNKEINITINDDKSFNIESNIDDDFEIALNISNLEGLEDKVIIRQKNEYTNDCICNLTVSSYQNASTLILSIDSTNTECNSGYEFKYDEDSLQLTLADDGNAIFKVIDETKYGKYNITIKNNCNLSETVIFDYSEKKDDEIEFYITENNCKELNIIFKNIEITNINGCDVEIPCSKSHKFDVYSRKSISSINDVNWKPVDTLNVESYDKDSITINNDGNGITRLINDNGDFITLIFNTDESCADSNVFTISETNNETKDSKITVDYKDDGNTVYLFSYTKDSNDNKKQLPWKVYSIDNMMKYTITPNKASGDSSVIISVDTKQIENLETSYVGTVIFQQDETYKKVTVNIKHDITGSTWCYDKDSITLTSITASSTIVNIPPCGGDSETITLEGYGTMNAYYKTNCDNDKYFDEKIVYFGPIPLTNIGWSGGNTISVSNIGNNYTWSKESPNSYGNNRLIEIFSGTVKSYTFQYDGNNFSGDASEQTIEVQAMQEVASIGTGTSEGSEILKEVVLRLDNSLVDISGETREAYCYAVLSQSSSLIDTCGNPINGSTQEGEEKNEPINEVNRYGSCDGFSINGNNIIIAPLDSDYIFKCDNDDCIEFPANDGQSSGDTGTTDEYVFEWLDTRIFDYINTLTTVRAIPPKETEIESVKSTGRRECTFYAKYDEMESNKVTLIQGIANNIDDVTLKYKVKEKPDWVKVTLSDRVGIDRLTTITINALDNPSEDIRNGNIILVQDESNNTLDICVTQVGKDVIKIPEFDYLVLRYYWDDYAGKDLDTATVIVNSNITTLDGKAVGWALNGSIDDILFHGGDNTGSGNESAYINFNELLKDGNFDILPDKVICDVYGNWYNTMLSGIVNMEITAYKGGTMSKDGFNFINTGGQIVYTTNQYTKVDTSCNSCVNDYKNNYSYVAKITYNKKTREATMNIINSKPN